MIADQAETLLQNPRIFTARINMGRSVESRNWAIKEQTVSDPVTGLTLEFKVDEEGQPVLRLYGERLVFGNRTIVFEDDTSRSHGETEIPRETNEFVSSFQRSHLNAPK